MRQFSCNSFIARIELADFRLALRGFQLLGKVPSAPHLEQPCVQVEELALADYQAGVLPGQARLLIEPGVGHLQVMDPGSSGLCQELALEPEPFLLRFLIRPAPVLELIYNSV